MTGSVKAALIAAAVCGFVAYAPAGLGQEPDSGGDVEGAGAPEASAPLSLFPSQTPTPADEAGSEQEPLSEGAIAVRNLDEVSTDSLGLMDPMSGGLPVTLWQGTALELVETLMPRLPARVPSPGTRHLTESLLLSIARPPQPAPRSDVFVDMSSFVPSAVGFAPDAPSEEPEPSLEPESGAGFDLGLLERRAVQLSVMGDWRNVGALLDLVPAGAMTPRLKTLETDALLVEGQVEAACAEARSSLAMSSEPYWQKVFAFCQLNNGDVDSAFLTLGLLREMSVDDPAFFWAAELMAGNRPITPNGLDVIAPLPLAMLRGAGRPFPDRQVRDGDPTLLRVLAEAEPLYIVEDDLEDEERETRRAEAEGLRLRSAERAVALGSLDADVLRGLYRAVDFSVPENESSEAGEAGLADQLEPDPPAGPVAASPDDMAPLTSLKADTVRERARLFQLAEAQTIPTAKAEVIARVIDLARAGRGRGVPDLATVGIIYGPLLNELVPSGELVWFAGHAARALLAAGDLDGGRVWLDLSLQYERTSIEAADIAASLWPVERLLDPRATNRFTPLRFKRWEDTRGSSLGADRSVLLNLFTALGETIATADWLPVMEGSPWTEADVPAPFLWHGMTLAAADGRVGETALMSLIAMHEDGPAEASPLTLAHVIRQLTAVGLESEARRLAVEAALLKGL